MKTKPTLVRVKLRDGANLEKLAGDMSPLITACGSAGTSIARQVVAGSGTADVPLSLIQLATDTQSGVEAIFDNFVLIDTRNAMPLVQSLVKERLAAT